MILLPPAFYGITARRVGSEEQIGQTGFVNHLGGVAQSYFVSRKPLKLILFLR